MEKRDGQPSVEQDVVEAVLKESRKDKIAYRIEALTCLSAILECYEIDRFADVAAIVFPAIEEVDILIHYDFCYNYHNVSFQ